MTAFANILFALHYITLHNVSNALNSTNIFTVCHGGSIWAVIDIKGCLRISFPVAQLVEHGASNAKIMGSIPRESKSW